MRFLYLLLLLVVLSIVLFFAEKSGFFTADDPDPVVAAIEEQETPVVTPKSEPLVCGSLSHVRAYLKAKTLRWRGRYAESIKAFHCFRQGYPESRYIGSALYWTADAYFQLGNLAGAVASFEQLINKHPTNKKIPNNAMTQLAKSYYRLGKREKAWCVLERFTDRFPDSSLVAEAEGMRRKIRLEERSTPNCPVSGHPPSPQPPLRGPVSEGSGFLVSPEGHVVTSHHVIESCGPRNIRTEIGYRTYTTSVIGKDEPNDIAILQAETYVDTYLALSDTDAYHAQDIWVAGFPFGTALPSSPTPTISRGIVSRITGFQDDYSSMQIDAAIQAGNSGGPIVDEHGNVVGIVVSKLDVAGFGEFRDHQPENINFGVNVSVLEALLEDLEIAFQLHGDDPVGKKELGQRLVNATVSISCSKKPGPGHKLSTQKVSTEKRRQ